MIRVIVLVWLLIGLNALALRLGGWQGMALAGVGVLLILRELWLARRAESEDRR